MEGRDDGGREEEGRRVCGRREDGDCLYCYRSPEGKVSFRIGFAAYDTAIYFFNLKVRTEFYKQHLVCSVWGEVEWGGVGRGGV